MEDNREQCLSEVLRRNPDLKGPNLNSMHIDLNVHEY